MNLMEGLVEGSGIVEGVFTGTRDAGLVMVVVAVVEVEALEVVVDAVELVVL